MRADVLLYFDDEAGAALRLAQAAALAPAPVARHRFPDGGCNCPTPCPLAWFCCARWTGPTTS